MQTGRMRQVKWDELNVSETYGGIVREMQKQYQKIDGTQFYQNKLTEPLSEPGVSF